MTILAVGGTGAFGFVDQGGRHILATHLYGPGNIEEAFHLFADRGMQRIFFYFFGRLLFAQQYVGCRGVGRGAELTFVAVGNNGGNQFSFTLRQRRIAAQQDLGKLTDG